MMKLDEYIDRLKEIEEKTPLWEKVREIVGGLVLSPDSAAQGAIEAEDWNAILHEALVKRAPVWYYEQIAEVPTGGTSTYLYTFEDDEQAREMKKFAATYGRAVITQNPPHSVLLRTLSPLPRDVEGTLEEKAREITGERPRATRRPTQRRPAEKGILYIGELKHTIANESRTFPKGTFVVFLRQPLGPKYEAVPYSDYSSGIQDERMAQKAGVLIEGPAEDFNELGRYSPDEAARQFY